MVTWGNRGPLVIARVESASTVTAGMKPHLLVRLPSGGRTQPHAAGTTGGHPFRRMEGDDVVRSPFRVPLLALKGADGVRERELSDLVSERCDLGFLYDNSFFQVGDGFPKSPFRFGELLRLGADTLVELVLQVGGALTDGPPLRTGPCSDPVAAQGR